jgi:hypothetical protein
MPSNSTARYPRREFLEQCAAIPLAAGLAMIAEPLLAADPFAAISLHVPKMPEADLAKEVEELLKCVDPKLLYHYAPLAAEKNAWPAWKRGL